MDEEMRGNAAPVLIVVTGSPATGKTTIAESLAERMHLPLLTKDAIKEEIYDSLEDAEPSDSHRIGFVAIQLMHSWAKRLLEKDVSLVLESNFKRSLSVDDLRELFALSRPVIVQCTAPVDEVIKRYVERSEEGERHPVHDDANHVDELRKDLERGEYDLRGLEVPSVTIDTSSWDDKKHVRDVVTRIRGILGGGAAPAEARRR
jgi:predicted kinase